MDSPRIERALISTSDKAGLTEFARELVALGVEIFSTGGTRRHLENGGIEVHDVSQYTGFPEMMDGRLKTLHPKIFGGILGRRDRDDDQASLAEHGIVPFELVVVNLYPFESTVARAEVTDAEAIEQIDIGGPSLVRAAAKNHAFVTIATSPSQYARIVERVKAAGHTTLDQRRELAGEAFAHTARYDQAIADYFARSHARSKEVAELPGTLSLSLKRKNMLRYGENPHQKAALYADTGAHGPSLVTAVQLNGKELSYNNLLDLDCALAMVRGLADPAAVVIKHNNPCGAAESKTLAAATLAALEGDPTSAFGSVLAFNRELDAASAEVLVAPGRFIEAIAAPSFEPASVEILTTRPKWKSNVRLMQVGQLGKPEPIWDFRRLAGGLLVQPSDVLPDPESEWRVVTKAQPDESGWRDLRFAWHMVRFVKSNAIVVAKDRALSGVGAGQMSRVDSVNLAVEKAAARARGASMGSDAFFPFADSIQTAAAAGITAVIQPGGSRNDDEVIQACDEHGLAMVFTGRRHFKH